MQTKVQSTEELRGVLCYSTCTFL